MFDIEAAKRAAGIVEGGSEKMEFCGVPRANRANRANPEAKNSTKEAEISTISTFSTFSTHPPPENAFFTHQRKACFWLYKLDTTKPGYVQMGLMTDDIAEAEKLLAAIYGQPVTGLHKKTREE